MRMTYDLINTFIDEIGETTLLSAVSEVIKAYEAKNLPVPIRKTYFSFSGEENKVTYFTDENNVKMEKNDITVRMNCFFPIKTVPSNAQILSEGILLYLSLAVEGITGFTVEKTEYDSDVDAYKITCKIYYSSTEAVQI